MGESTLIPAASQVRKLVGSRGGLVAIRPEHIGLVKAKGNLGRARLEAVTYQGSFRRLLARSLVDPGIVFVIHMDATQAASEGAEVSLAVDPQHVIAIRSS